MADAADSQTANRRLVRNVGRLFGNVSAKNAGKAGIAVGLAMLLTACPEEENPRDCPGFNHPGVADWSVTDTGQTMSFTDNAGTAIVYELMSVEKSEPAVQYGSGDVVTCNNTASLTFSTEGSGEELEFRFRQFLRDESPEQSALTLRLYRTQGGAAEVDSLHTVFLNESDYENNNEVYSSTTTTSYVPVGIVNGVEYQTVITSQRNEDSAPIQAPAGSETALTRVVFAKGFGLVQMELQDGAEFNRVD